MSSVQRRRHSGSCVLHLLVTAALLALGHSAVAQAAEPPAAAAGLAVELNKLEPFDKGCRAYVVVNNTTDIAYQAMKLDLIVFQPDGIIARRFALDLAPLKAQKKSVKLFEIDQPACDKIGSFLINDVIDCKSESGAADNCLQRLTTSSKTSVQLSK